MDQKEQQKTGKKQATDEEIEELVAEALLIKAIERRMEKAQSEQSNQPAKK